MFKLTITFFLILSLSDHGHAQITELKHPNCKVILRQGNNKDLKEFNDQAVEILRTRGFFPENPPADEKKWSRPVYYFELQRELEAKGFYPPCLIKIALWELKGDAPSSKDKKIYSYTGRRAHPRVTRSGSTRCKMATKDAMAFFPSCLKL